MLCWNTSKSTLIQLKDQRYTTNFNKCHLLQTFYILTQELHWKRLLQYIIREIRRLEVIFMITPYFKKSILRLTRYLFMASQVFTIDLYKILIKKSQKWNHSEPVQLSEQTCLNYRIEKYIFMIQVLLFKLYKSLSVLNLSVFSVLYIRNTFFKYYFTLIFLNYFKYRLALNFEVSKVRNFNIREKNTRNYHRVKKGLYQFFPE